MGNVSMLSLTAEQIHERLVERWSNQMTPMVLLSGINLTLAFGSEWANVSSGLGENAQVAFLCISAWAFVLNFMGSLALANMIIWMQRVPEWRMHEFVRDARITRFDVTFNNMSTMSTFVQIGMAFYALHPAALGTYIGAFGVSAFFMWRLGSGVADFGGVGSLNEPQPPPADWPVKTASQRWLMEDSAATLAASAELEALLAEALPSMGRSRQALVALTLAREGLDRGTLSDAASLGSQGPLLLSATLDAGSGDAKLSRGERVRVISVLCKSE
jgi:hypothetical protein